MRAIALVGGAGTRLRPLTVVTPKPLLPIALQSLLERQLDWLARYGVDDVVLSMGYLPEVFAARFPEGPYRLPGGGSVRLRYAVEPEPLGTAGAVRFAAAAGDITERFVVCNGDVLTGLDLGALVAAHEARGARGTLHLTRVEDPSAFGVVPTRADGEVEAFVEKPAPGTAASNWINAGTYVLEPSVLDAIPEGVAVSIERETFPSLLEPGGQLYALGTGDYWIDVGTPDAYRRAHADLLAGRLGVPPVPGATERGSGVWTLDEVELASDATVVGPSLLGAGASIARGARVVGSTVGANVEVGPDAVLDGAVLGDGVRVEAGARVQASVVGPGSCIGAGAIVEADSVIGPGATVDAGAVVTGGRVP